MTGRIPLSIPDLRGREAEFLLKCVEDNWVSSAGPEIGTFETAIGSLADRRHAVAVMNGTAGLHLALLAAGVIPGDHVIVPDWTFAASANAVRHAGAVSHFVDVSLENWALDADLCTKALKTDARIKAMIAVDPLGHAADFAALESVCKEFGIALIEDAAGAIGARYRGRPCGSLGDISVFSFNGNKTLTTGGGGMILTDDDEMAVRVRHLSTQARSGAEYIHDEVGFNYRMTNINAALGLAQLERLSEMLSAKRQIAGRYDTALKGRNDMTAMPRPAYSDSSCWLYSLKVASEADAQSIIASMDRNGIEARTFWRSLSAQSPWSECPRTLQGISSALSGTVVSLPSSSSLSNEEQDRVIDVLNSWSGTVAMAD